MQGVSRLEKALRATSCLLVAFVLAFAPGLSAYAAPTAGAGWDASYDAAVIQLSSLADEIQAQAQEGMFVDEDGYVVRTEPQAIASVASARTSLPESYTAPYTSVKNQGAANSCWSFASIASLESAYLAQSGLTGAGSSAIDLSEAQVVYGTYNGETADGTPDGEELQVSGNDHSLAFDGCYGFGASGEWQMVASTLAAGRGASYEDDARFITSDSMDMLEALAGYMAQDCAAAYDLSRLRLDYAESVPAPAPFDGVDPDTGMAQRTVDEAALQAMKQAIYTTGALSVSYYADPDSSSEYYHLPPGADRVTDTGSTYRYAPNYWTYDADNVGGWGAEALYVNHYVAIVGWDDSYSRWNFATPLLNESGVPRAYDSNIAEVETLDGVEYIVPNRDGAWLFKNSWGEGTAYVDGSSDSVGDAGLFHMSFCEKTIGECASFVPDYDEGFDVVHQYDGAEASGFDCGFTNVSAGANVFSSDTGETLRAVGVWTLEPGTRLDIRVYTGLSDPADPESGALALEQREQIANAGWYTVDLDAPVDIASGTDYSVVVTMSQEGGGSYLPVEMAHALNPCKVYIGAGESFMKTEIDGRQVWVDMLDVSDAIPDSPTGLGNLCVKAYADSGAVEDPDQGTGDESSGDGQGDPGSGSGQDGSGSEGSGDGDATGDGADEGDGSGDGSTSDGNGQNGGQQGSDGQDSGDSNAGASAGATDKGSAPAQLAGTGDVAAPVMVALVVCAVTAGTAVEATARRRYARMSERR